MSQFFCNAIMQNYSFAIRCIHQYIRDDVIKNEPKIIDWQGHMIQLAFPYKQGYIDGGLFLYVWLPRILKINIYLCDPG